MEYTIEHVVNIANEMITEFEDLRKMQRQLDMMSRLDSRRLLHSTLSKLGYVFCLDLTKTSPLTRMRLKTMPVETTPVPSRKQGAGKQFLSGKWTEPHSGVLFCGRTLFVLR